MTAGSVSSSAYQALYAGSAALNKLRGLLA